MLTIKNADKILNALENRAMIYDYDIDSNEDYQAVCELVTAADWEDREINGFDLDEFNELVKAVNAAILEEV